MGTAPRGRRSCEPVASRATEPWLRPDSTRRRARRRALTVRTPVARRRVPPLPAVLHGTPVVDLHGQCPGTRRCRTSRAGSPVSARCSWLPHAHIAVSVLASTGLRPWGVRTYGRPTRVPTGDAPRTYGRRVYLRNPAYLRETIIARSPYLQTLRPSRLSRRLYKQTPHHRVVCGAYGQTAGRDPLWFPHPSRHPRRALPSHHLGPRCASCAPRPCSRGSPSTISPPTAASLSISAHQRPGRPRPSAGTSPPARTMAHPAISPTNWTRLSSTGSSMPCHDRCPACSTWESAPDAPQLDLRYSGRQQAHLKRAFHQNASAYIVAYAPLPRPRRAPRARSKPALPATA